VKIHGKKLEGPKEQVVVIPRDSGDIVFKAKAVLDFKDFDAVCPVPKPPEVIRPGGVRSVDPEDPEYKKALDKWASQKSTWMILKSLSATDGLEWETVDWANPDTWSKYQQEMSDSGLSSAEVARIIDIVMDACGLNQDKIDEATKRFLAGQGAVQNIASSQDTEQSGMPSGEVAKG